MVVVLDNAFVDLCEIHKIPYTEIRLEKGKKLTEQDLYVHNHKDFTAFVVNVHETQQVFIMI